MRLPRGLNATQLHLLLTKVVVQGLEESTSAPAADLNRASSKGLAAKAERPQEPPKPGDFPSLSKSSGGGTAAAVAAKEAATAGLIAAAKETVRQRAAASTASKTVKRLIPGEAAADEKVALDNGKGITKQPAKQHAAQVKPPPQLAPSAAETSQAAGEWEGTALTQAVEAGWGASTSGHGIGWPAGTSAQQSLALDPQPQVLLTHSRYLERTSGAKSVPRDTQKVSQLKLTFA